MSKSIEFRRVDVTAQFYNTTTGATTTPKTTSVLAPFYPKLRKDHPDYRAAIDAAVKDLATSFGLPADSRPVCRSVSAPSTKVFPHRFKEPFKLIAREEFSTSYPPMVSKPIVPPALSKVLEEIYDLAESHADGAPDASQHDKLCNWIAWKLQPFMRCCQF